ncbi:hypothetical protein YC2023_098235 [Brassica napus]
MAPSSTLAIPKMFDDICRCVISARQYLEHTNGSQEEILKFIYDEYKAKVTNNVTKKLHFEANMVKMTLRAQVTDGLPLDEGLET